jgi:hypothetical protein
MMRRAGVLSASVIVFGACATARTPLVEQFSAEVAVDADGAVEVREELLVRFPDQAASRFERRLDVDRADAVTFKSATVDGRNLDPGVPGESEVTVDHGRQLVVVWTFPPSPAPARRFGLAYRAIGAVAVRGTRGTLRHPVLSNGHPYRVAAGRIVLALPPDAHVFEGARIEEPGWSVARAPTGFSAERRNLTPSEPATVVAEIAIDPGAIREPEWQRHDERANQLAPAFVSGGAFIVAIGAGVLWIVRFQYRRTRRDQSGRVDGTVEAERQAVRSGLRAGGIVSVVLAAVLWGVTALMLGHLGPWPLALPIGVLVVGLALIALGPRLL